MNTVKLLLITGTVGVGKSSVADEVFEILRRNKKPIALINIDEFGYAYPHPDNDQFNVGLQLSNLSACVNNYLAVGANSFVVPCVLERQENVDALINAIGATETTIIRLIASEITLDERIASRHLGGDANWHIARSRELTEIMDKFTADWTIVDT